MSARTPRLPATLLDAVRTRDLDVVRARLDAGDDADAHGPSQELPLGAAIYAAIGHPEVFAITTLLLARGADPQKVGALDETPLEAAVYVGQSRVVREMLRVLGPRFALPAPVAQRPTLLQRACSGGMLWLVEQCADLGDACTALTPDGRSCLHLASSVYTAAEATPAERLALVEWLLAQGLDPNLHRPGEWGGTPLHFAAASADAAVVTRLLDAGADVHARSDVSAHQPIHRAALNDARGVVEALCAGGADVNAVAAGGLRPLHLLTKRSRAVTAPDRVDGFVDQGAAVNALDDRGVSPLAEAIAGHASTRAPLEPREHEIFARLVARGADLRCAAPGGATLLILAARINDLALAQIALRGGEVDQLDGHGWSALHYAATQPDGALAAALLAARADPTVTTRKLHKAARTRIPAGATPLDIARAVGATAVVERLT